VWQNPNPISNMRRTAAGAFILQSMVEP